MWGGRVLAPVKEKACKKEMEHSRESKKFTEASLGPLLVRCVILDKPQFPLLYTGADNNTYLPRWL